MSRVPDYEGARAGVREGSEPSQRRRHPLPVHEMGTGRQTPVGAGALGHIPTWIRGRVRVERWLVQQQPHEIGLDLLSRPPSPDT